MIRSLEAMTSSQIKRDHREDKKKSMLSRLAPEAGSLFMLLSAKSWKDTSPKLLNLTKSLSKRWTRKISKKGILSFLASGHAAAAIVKAPGSFAIFMFSPLNADTKNTDQKSRVLQVKAMFRKAEFYEELTKHFAKNDFFLAESLTDLEEQLCTCIKCLEKLTNRFGIASEG
jgi:hypothetical protein